MRKTNSVHHVNKAQHICREGDTEYMIYQYAVSQTLAIAQSTAVQFGALHSAAILLRNDDKYSDADGKPRYKLYTWGRGFYGQLGTHRDSCSSVLHPRSVCLGYTPFDVCSLFLVDL
jgi:hypothetical protein